MREHNINVGYDVDVLDYETNTWMSIAPDLTYPLAFDVRLITGVIASSRYGSYIPAATVYHCRYKLQTKENLYRKHTMALNIHRIVILY